ncbi:capsular polysaccharide synthesis protein [Lactobacillus johnsonii]|uniref:capsular polysaccharide synthesis protein n=1 Tax=Lactobacillus johnsonii TaxID=33959 RepID=UPI0022E1708D|nr:capsular polysaccharide synthesis protein [Lactobacillus johnsonii]
MKLVDYRKKAYLKICRRQVELVDTKRSSGNPKGYDKYFKKVLHALQPDFINATRILNLNQSTLNKNSKLLNNIYVMWWQGMDNAPALIINNIQRMKRIFGKDNVHIITEKNWKQYCSIPNTIIEKFNVGKVSIAAPSDVIRFNLLKEHGGLWIDSTVILNNKCKDILSQYNDNGFFTISNFEQDYHFISKSRWTAWFIGGKAGYPLFEFATAFYSKYFENHDFLLDYYTIDDIIAYFYINNAEFKNDIDRISYNWNPYLWSQNMYKPYKKEYIEKFKRENVYSIQKFTYKYTQANKNTIKTLLDAVINNEI